MKVYLIGLAFIYILSPAFAQQTDSSSFSFLWLEDPLAGVGKRPEGASVTVNALNMKFAKKLDSEKSNGPDLKSDPVVQSCKEVAIKRLKEALASSSVLTKMKNVNVHVWIELSDYRTVEVYSGLGPTKNPTFSVQYDRTRSGGHETLNLIGRILPRNGCELPSLRSIEAKLSEYYDKVTVPPGESEKRSGAQ